MSGFTPRELRAIHRVVSQAVAEGRLQGHELAAAGRVLERIDDARDRDERAAILTRGEPRRVDVCPHGEIPAGAAGCVDCMREVVEASREVDAGAWEAHSRLRVALAILDGKIS